MKISPTSGFVLLKEVKKTQGNNIFFVSAKDTNNQLQEVSEVIDVGPTLTTDYGTEIVAPCKKGDKVFHKSWSFDNFTYQNQNLRLVKFQDITGVIKE